MTASRGFIALAALIFGRWHGGCLRGRPGVRLRRGVPGTVGLPRVADPVGFLLMAPYLVTLVVVAGLVGRARPPAADGQPFER